MMFLKVITIVCLCFVLQSNYLVFMAELFWWFEVVKPSFVQPKILDTNGTQQLLRINKNQPDDSFATMLVVTSTQH